MDKVRIVGHSAQSGPDVPFVVPFVHRLRFTEDVFGKDRKVLGELLEPAEGQRRARVQFYVDDHLLAAQPELPERIASFLDAYSQQLEQAGPVRPVPGGEACKNDVRLLEGMLRAMHDAGLDRRSYVVVVGGGAVLDTVGFAAAIAHRGIRLVRLPTTTLSQADSGVGVKNSVNLFGKKNWLGTFAVPWGVVNDAQLLRTLSPRDYRCGFAEAVKVALLKDPSLFRSIRRRAREIVEQRGTVARRVIRRSALLHLDHITSGGDPFEMTAARPLDFGHWSAHRLEAMTNFQMRHGEAVAIGLAIDTMYSTRVLGLSPRQGEAVLETLQSLGFALDHPALEDVDALMEGLEEFRQHLGGQLTLTMLRRIGQPVEIHEVDPAALCWSIEQVRRRGGAAGRQQPTCRTVGRDVAVGLLAPRWDPAVPAGCSRTTLGALHATSRTGSVVAWGLCGGIVFSEPAVGRTWCLTGRPGGR